MFNILFCHVIHNAEHRHNQRMRTDPAGLLHIERVVWNNNNLNTNNVRDCVVPNFWQFQSILVKILVFFTFPIHTNLNHLCMMKCLDKIVSSICESLTTWTKALNHNVSKQEFGTWTHVLNHNQSILTALTKWHASEYFLRLNVMIGHLLFAIRNTVCVHSL